MFSPFAFWSLAKPGLLNRIDHPHPCFLNGKLVSWIIGEPEVSFGPCDAAPKRPILLVG